MRAYQFLDETKTTLSAFNDEQPVAEGSLEEIDRRGFLKGMGAAAVAGATGSAMAQSQPVDASRAFANMRKDDPLVQHNKDIDEMARAIYDQIITQRGQPMDRRQQQMWMTIARDKASEKLAKYAPGRSATQPQNSGFPSQGSERRVSRNIDNFESVEQGLAEGAPISGDGGAVDNFKQQMANNTEIAYQKGMAEAKKKKKKKSSRSLGRYFFPGYGYYGSGESGEGGGDGGGGESKNRGMAEGAVRLQKQ